MIDGMKGLAELRKILKPIVEKEENYIANITTLGKEDAGKYPPSKEYDFTKMDSELYNIFNKAILEYVKDFKELGISKDNGYFYLKYQDEKEHDFYQDGKLGAVAAILYLNDDYEGGELEFKYIDMRIKPQKGDILLFPSNYLFTLKSRPITKGEKHVIITWFGEQGRL